MKAEIQIDPKELAREVSAEILRVIKPLLKTSDSEDSILTVKVLSEFLEVSPQWIYDRVQLNEIPYYKRGKFLRFRKSKIVKWLDSIENPTLSTNPKLQKKQKMAP
jgi:excisionase family DNA binding protein